MLGELQGMNVVAAMRQIAREDGAAALLRGRCARARAGGAGRAAEGDGEEVLCGGGGGRGAGDATARAPRPVRSGVNIVKVALANCIGFVLYEIAKDCLAVDGRLPPWSQPAVRERRKALA